MHASEIIQLFELFLNRDATKTFWRLAVEDQGWVPLVYGSSVGFFFLSMGS